MCGGVDQHIVRQPREANTVDRGTDHLIGGFGQAERHALIGRLAQTKNGNIRCFIKINDVCLHKIIAVKIDIHIRLYRHLCFTNVQRDPFTGTGSQIKFNNMVIGNHIFWIFALFSNKKSAARAACHQVAAFIPHGANDLGDAVFGIQCAALFLLASST